LTGGSTLASFSLLGGAVAQLGERLNGIQEVDGSIPFGSTNFRHRVPESPPVCLPPCRTETKERFVHGTRSRPSRGVIALPSRPYGFGPHPEVAYSPLSAVGKCYR
jgi:hypothetical protein